MESNARVRNALLTTFGVLAALVLVAVAARGSTPVGDGATRRPSDALLDVLFSFYLAAIVAGALLFLYLLLIQRRVRTGDAPPRRSMIASLLGLFAIALLLSRIVAGREPAAPPEPEVVVIGAGDTTLPVTTSITQTTYEAEIAWIPVLVTVALIVVAAGAWWLSSRARRRARGETGLELAAAVAQAVDDSLDDLRAEPDPRRAVIAAYARLERVLAAHGLPRKPAEAPLEYLGRMLAELSVTDKAARALTDLFERAKFSQHAVGVEMKAEAIAALETVRDDLLAARELAERARIAALEAYRERAAAP